MGEYIGLRSGLNLLISKDEPFDSLKQQSLFFDKVEILGLNGCLEFDLNLTDEQLTEIQWLMENEFLCDVILDPELIPRNDATIQIGKFALESHNRWKKLLTEAYCMQKFPDVKPRLDIERNALESASLRLLATQMEAHGDVQAIPLLPHKEYLHEFPDTTKVDVAKVIIKNLPVPDQSTPWEKIFDYRNDPETRKHLISLRRWIRKIASDNLSISEIEEELEYLTNEFETYMKMHKYKSNTETIETLVKVPLEILEDLIKLKFSKIPEPFFAMQKRRVSLMEAEIGAPGKEIAYILKTKELFKNKNS